MRLIVVMFMCIFMFATTNKDYNIEQKEIDTSEFSVCKVDKPCEESYELIEKQALESMSKFGVTRVTISTSNNVTEATFISEKLMSRRDFNLNAKSIANLIRDGQNLPHTIVRVYLKKGDKIVFGGKF